MMLQLCVYVEMRFKQANGCYRPSSTTPRRSQ